jgi:magnesium transporter
MARFVKDQKTARGKPPGTLVFVGKQKVEDATMRVIDYSRERIMESTPTALADVIGFDTSDSVSWIDIIGLHNTELIGGIGASYGIHPLILEDILNTGQRPKIEEMDNYIFISVKMMRIEDVESVILENPGKDVLSRAWLPLRLLYISCSDFSSWNTYGSDI